ncbi:tachylectin-2-like [Spea bombifrons]|uniref:tachylectin-2-like n=1 Tax=Spea bombifrons TaxID=233779 RepID=UPI00234BE480|nr:tachylectin-2-like [Spea bombifrons]
MAELETVLFALAGDFTVRVGLPPKNRMDSYNTRAASFGKLNDASKVLFNPKGELYVVRGGDLYTGHMPSRAVEDWYSAAKRVGKGDWSKFKFLFFHPDGTLYGATHAGEFYKGPVPTNENVSWLYGQATMIGTYNWNRFDALFFDADGIMYGVTDTDKFLKRSPPTYPEDEWMSTSTTIGDGGWSRLTHFMGFSPDRMLWCVDKYNGNIYKGPPPTKKDTGYLKKAEQLGWDYNKFRVFCFTKDKTIQSMLSFEFLIDSGRITSESVEVVKKQIYDNRGSSTPLKHTFTFNKTMKETSEFTHAHGFNFEMGTELTFKNGIPGMAEGGTKITMKFSTTHNWSFTTTNETETSFSSSTEVELEGGKAIRVVASVKKAEMDVPYRARVRTLFGYETTIEGVWKGVSHYDLVVKQEDYSG